jgi:hypothetical protein
MVEAGGEMDKPTPDTETGLTRLREMLRLLYHGHSPGAVRFQRVVLLVDLAIIAFFIVSPVLRERTPRLPRSCLPISRRAASPRRT